MPDFGMEKAGLGWIWEKEGGNWGFEGW